MKHYKKPDGSVWAFESDGSQDRFIASDMVQVSGDALAVLLQPKAPSPLDQIVKKETEKPFTHRALRELSKTVALMAQAVTGQDPLTNPEVAKIFNLDAEIAGLRDQAKVQGLI